MTTKNIKLLVLASYINNKLDEKAVEKIANLLSKKDLKAYIRGLTLEDKKHKIYLALPSKKLYNAKRKDLEKLFVGKDVLFQEDPSLLLGVRILDNDMVYEVSLSDRLNRIAQAVGEAY